MSTQFSKKHLLHVFPSFGIGGVPLRMCRIINHFGGSLSHTIIALDGDFAARSALDKRLDIEFLNPMTRARNPLASTLRSAHILRRLAPQMLLTYNWGSIEWVIANRFSRIRYHIHFEAGFSKEEAHGQIWRRVLCRRWVLGGATWIVVPSELLMRVAIETWKISTSALIFIPNGVDAARFTALERVALPSFTRRPFELVVGTLAPLRPEKNISRLLDAFAGIDRLLPARLVIAGDGLERNMLEGRAQQLGISDRVIFTGMVSPESVLGKFDIFAISSDTEQMPNAVLEAMAAKLPVVAVDVGDIRSMVSERNRDFVVPVHDKQAFTRALETLLRDADLRDNLGRANFDRVTSQFSSERMMYAYSRLFHPERQSGS